MAKKTNLYIYRVPHTTIEQLAYNTIYMLKDDFADLQEFGIQQEQIDQLQLLLDQLQKHPFEEELYWNKAVLKQQRNETKDQLIYLLSKLEVILRLELGKKSDYYQMFMLNAISTFNIKLLIERALQAKQVYYGHHHELLKKHIAPELIEQIELKANELNKDTTTHLASVAMGTLDKQLRVKASNDLYAYMSKLRGTAKRIWQLKGDFVRSNVYLMPKQKNKRKRKVKGEK